MVVHPYVRGLSECVCRALWRVRVKAFFKPHWNLAQILSHHKDQVQGQQRTGVVYKIPCGTCDQTYVGQLGRTVEHRVKECKRALVSGDINTSALAEHAIEHCHRIA